MGGDGTRTEQGVSDAYAALPLLAVDPVGLGGITLRGMPGPARDACLEYLRSLLPDDTPVVKVPVNVGQDRLLGGLDVGATLAHGKPVFASGLLEAADGGLLVLSMAERMPAAAAAIIGAAMDSGEIRIERDGVTRRRPSHVGVIALDEGLDEDERISDALQDRLAFFDDLRTLARAERQRPRRQRADVGVARERLAAIDVADASFELLGNAAAAFGISSARAALFAVRAARAAAALDGRSAVSEDDVALAARLVHPQRATTLPAPPEPDDAETPQDEHVDDEGNNTDTQTRMPDEMVVDAVSARVPPDLLERLQHLAGRQRLRTGGSRGGPRTRSRLRGRPVGARLAETTDGQRLNVLATLKAAAPWQTIRRRQFDATRRQPRPIELRREDLHVTRFEDRVETTTIFVVDASGSQAAQRLAEVKGAIELLLNECYVRRDQVALIAFRGAAADALLSPTRALARVKRSLAALPGGGGTPLAAGLDAAREMAESVARQGRNPTIVVMTDGRANVGRDGQPGAPAAQDEALAAGRLLHVAGYRSLVVDTSRRPRPRARELASAMHAVYVPLPNADAHSISRTVQEGIA